MNGPLDPVPLARGLHDAGVKYVVIGGFAVIAYGVVRVTKDLDICPEPGQENLTRLAALLRTLGAEQMGVGDFAPEEMPFDPTNPSDLAEGGNFRLVTGIGVLDIMQWVPGMPGEHAYAELAAGAVSAEVEGVPIPVCSLADLRRMKRAAGRPQDLQDLADLAAAHGDEGAAPQS